MNKEVVESKQCLFCLDKIIPYSLSSRQEDETSDKVSHFRKLCKLIGILAKQKLNSFPISALLDNSDDNKPINEDDNRASSCETLLCLCCVELVEKLIKLWDQLKEIQEKIGETTGKIREVIIKTTETEEGTSVIKDAATKRKGTSPKICSKEDDLEAALLELRRKVLQDFLKCKKGNLTTTERTKSKKPKRTKKSKDVPARKTDKRKRPERSLEEATPTIPDLEEDAGCGLMAVVHQEATIKIEVEHADDANGDSDWLPDDHGDADDLPLDSHFEFSTVTAKQETTENRDEEEEERSTPEVDEQAKTRPRRSKRAAPPENLNPPPPQKIKQPKLESSQEDRKFTCPHCRTAFDRRSDLALHREQNHPPLDTNTLPITKIYEKTGDRRKRIEIWVCSICGHRTRGGHRRLRYFMEHMLSHEVTATPPLELHACDKCDKAFTLPINLDLHKVCIHDLKHILLRCEFCDKLTDCKTQADFITHLRSHMGDPTAPVHACKSCPMAASTLDKLLEHMKKHSSSKKLYCPECPEEYPSLSELHRHCQKSHPDLKQKFDCTHCTKSFLMKISLEKHLKFSHGIGDDTFGGEFMCSKCNPPKVFKSKAILQSHLDRQHGKKSHQCLQCDKSFLFRGLLKSHIEEKHDNVRYQCPNCPKSYSDRAQLGYHMRMHTGEDLYTCDRCGKQFPRLQQLKIHSVVHLEKSEQSRCVCEVCGKEFSGEHNLRKHRTIHQEKKLECQYCHLKFARRDNLKSHLRTHTGERPYVCPVCSKDFNRRDILFVHMKMHGFATQEEAAKIYDKQGDEKLKNESS